MCIEKKVVNENFTITSSPKMWCISAQRGPPSGPSFSATRQAAMHRDREFINTRWPLAAWPAATKKLSLWPQKILLKLGKLFSQFTREALWHGFSCFKSTLMRVYGNCDQRDRKLRKQPFVVGTLKFTETELSLNVSTRAEKGRAVKRAVRSWSNVWCREGLARALLPRFRWDLRMVSIWS